MCEFDFNTLSIGTACSIDNYVTKGTSPTSFDFSFLPEILFEKDIFKNKFDPIKTTIWFSYLHNWSKHYDGTNTESSNQRAFKFDNVLMLNQFLGMFVIPGGSVQIHKNRIRANLQRENINLEQIWTTNLGKHSSSNSEYLSNLMKILHKSGVDPKEIPDLRKIYNHTRLGFAHGSNCVNCSLGNAASYLPLTKEDFYNKLQQHLFSRKGCYVYLDKPLWKHYKTINQCGLLTGRDVRIVFENKYILIKVCFRCRQMGKNFIADYSEDSPCLKSSLLPVGLDIPQNKRNEISDKAWRKILKRNKTCVVCKVIGTNPTSKIVRGHIVSALVTTHLLTEKDGVCICENHNSTMGINNLLSIYPELKNYCEKNSLNTDGSYCKV